MQNEADLVTAWSAHLGSGSGFCTGRLERSLFLWVSPNPKLITSAEYSLLIRDNCPHLRDGPELGNKGIKTETVLYRRDAYQYVLLFLEPNA